MVVLDRLFCLCSFIPWNFTNSSNVPRQRQESYFCSAAQEHGFFAQQNGRAGCTKVHLWHTLNPLVRLWIFLKMGIIVVLLALLPARNFPNRQTRDKLDVIALSRIAAHWGLLFSSCIWRALPGACQYFVELQVPNTILYY